VAAQTLIGGARWAERPCWIRLTRASQINRVNTKYRQNCAINKHTVKWVSAINSSIESVVRNSYSPKETYAFTLARIA
jgi:hypothetical protein